MKVREAVSAAKQVLQEFFAEEKIENLGLEEVEFDDVTNTWSITFGFSRPWDKLTGALAALEGASRGFLPWRRDYKVVRIADDTGRFLSIKNRETTDAT